MVCRQADNCNTFCTSSRNAKVLTNGSHRALEVDDLQRNTLCTAKLSMYWQQSSAIHLSFHIITSYLPLSLLACQELVQCSNNLLERRQVLLELLLDLRIVTAELSVEVLPVRCSAHGGAEEGLDDEGVVGLEGVAIGIAEGVGELLVGVGDVVTEGLGGEVKTTTEVSAMLLGR